MIQKVKELGIGELLGITDSEELKPVEDTLLEVSITHALERLIKSLKDDNVRGELIAKLTNEEVDVDSVLKDYPDVLEFIEEEAYIYKKGALESYFDVWMNKCSDINQKGTLEENIQNLISALNTDNSDLFDIEFNKFNRLKLDIITNQK